MLFNKKSMLTMFATAALLSTSALGGVSAFADGSSDKPAGNTNGPSDNTIGSYDNSGKAKGNLNALDSNGKVSGQSDAHIHVVNGYLVLETVPSLGFQDVKQSNNNDETSSTVSDNDTVLRTDSFFRQGNNPDNLTVLDARNSDGTTGSKNSGYNVTASLGNFANYDSGGNSTSSVTNGDRFQLNLNGKVLSSDSGSNINLNSNVRLNSNNNANTVLSSNTIGGGSTSVNFNKGNSSNATSLLVPKGTPSGNYAAPITWTLNPSSDGQALNGTTSGGK